MSMYNMLFGVNKVAPILLATLGLDQSKVPRFRDAYIQDGKIVIYTRTGGGNRPYYESLDECKENYPDDFEGDEKYIPTGPWNEDLRALPEFVEDFDEDFDETYANFYFKFPEDYKADLEMLSKAVDEDATPSDKWNKLMETLKQKV